MDVEEEEVSVEPEPTKWSWLYVLSVAIAGLGGIFKLAGAICDDMEHGVDSHLAFKRSKEEFARRAGLEIEALTREPAPEGAKVAG